MNTWRPKNWKYGNWKENYLRSPPVILEEQLYNAFEAGADALLKAINDEAIKKED